MLRQRKYMWFVVEYIKTLCPFSNNALDVFQTNASNDNVDKHELSKYCHAV